MNKVKSYKEINDLAFESHYQMVTIHPFADGNGRISRLLMNYVQKYHNTSLSIVYQTFKSDYIKALNETRKEKMYLFLENLCTYKQKSD
ncbi:MAG: Fic family protein [Polaribacter sp.]